MQEIIQHWKASLGQLLAYYETRRGSMLVFFPMLFCFFVFVNIFCYWWAMFTAFPEELNAYYFKVQFPVGFLGALFDSLSFFVTVFIIRRALRATNNWEYFGHLSIDLVIALLATLWVVFVFSVSGWIIKLIEGRSQLLAYRNDRYQGMVLDALTSPGDNLRNIYFGLVMGISAMIPTCLHMLMFLRATWRSLRNIES